MAGEDEVYTVPHWHYRLQQLQCSFYFLLNPIILKDIRTKANNEKPTKVKLIKSIRIEMTQYVQ